MIHEKNELLEKISQQIIQHIENKKYRYINRISNDMAKKIIMK